jgi:hypothetical protein
MLSNLLVEKNQSRIAVFGILFGAVCWGLIWYPYRILQEAGISGVASSFYTYVIAVGVFAVVFLNNGVLRSINLKASFGSPF